MDIWIKYHFVLRLCAAEKIDEVRFGIFIKCGL